MSAVKLQSLFFNEHEDKRMKKNDGPEPSKNYLVLTMMEMTIMLMMIITMNSLMTMQMHNEQ